MKKIFYLAVLITAVFTSCQKDALEQEEPLKVDNQYTVKSLEANDDMLSFSSVEELDKTVVSLLGMDRTELALWYSQHPNFTSLDQIYNDANGEFEAADNAGVGDLKIIEEIKNKYVPYLLFNENPEDDEEYCPVIPSELYGKPLVCNKNGDVLVNGEILNFNNITSIEETSYYKSTRTIQTKGTDESKMNELHMSAGRKKMFVKSYVVLKDGRFRNGYVQITCKKKWNNWAKWRNYNSTVYIKEITNDWTRPWSNWVIDSESPGWIKDLMDGTIDEFIIHSHDSGKSIGLGAFNDHSKYASGKLQIGSDGTRSKGMSDGFLNISLY